MPHDLAIDAAGNLHVPETEAGRILVLTGDFSWVQEGGCRHPPPDDLIIFRGP